MIAMGRYFRDKALDTGTRRIAEIPEPCRHPEHNPAMGVCLPPGLYEHECPGCGATVRFNVPRVTCGGGR
jgi:hypothetical protein